MSSNNTRVPGADQAGFHDFYSRAQSQSAHKGTVVPGMHGVAPKIGDSTSVQPKVPVVGFLYSISRQGFGEFWPLHVGSNKIGRSSDCDICLKEATVSDHHASLNIKQLKSTKKLLASIRDEGSKNGIYVNDEELDYDAHNVMNHDILTIGDNYKLLVIIIDAEELGLTISENFQPTEENPALENIGFQGDGNATIDHLYNSANRVDNGTVAMDGSAGPEYGKTKFL